MNSNQNKLKIIPKKYNKNHKFCLIPLKTSKAVTISKPQEDLENQTSTILIKSTKSSSKDKRTQLKNMYLKSNLKSYKIIKNLIYPNLFI